MTLSWAIPVLATVAVWVAIVLRARWSVIFWAQTVSLLASACGWWAYYSPRVTQYQYEGIAFTCEAPCIGADVFVLISILRRTRCLTRSCWQECFVAGMIVLHQHVNASWFAVADIGFYPGHEFAYLVSVRAILNYAYLLSLAILVVAQPANGDAHARRTS